MKYRFCSALLLTMGLIGASCGGDDGASRDSAERSAAARSRPPATVAVVASTAILADFVSQVGGERVTVRSVVPAGADVHTFTLSPADVRAVAAADLVVLNGAGLEAGFGDAVEENAGGVVLALTQGMELRPSPFPLPRSQQTGGDPGSTADEPADEPPARPRDPHFWMDIDLTLTAVEAIRAALSELDPDGAVAYTARANAYRATLRALDDEIQALLRDLPAPRRFLVTFHDAFGYFAARYGLTTLGFVVEGPAEEPSAGEIAALVAAMRHHAVRAIYREPQFRAAVVQQIAREAGAEVRDIHSSALSADLPTYVDLMRANARAIAQ